MKIILAVLLTGLTFSCSTRTCKPNETITQDATLNQNQPIAGETKISPTITMTNPLKKIKIFKPDGSIQCEQGTAMPAAEMAKQLGDIKIYSSETKHDGLLRIQVCGQPTGNSNVYEINESDFEKASKLGFKKWKNN